MVELMENNVSLANNMISAGSAFGGSEMQGAMRVHNNNQNPRTVQQPHQSQRGQVLMGHTPMQDVFRLKMGLSNKCDHSIAMADNDKVERGKYSTTDDEDLSSNGDVDPYKGLKPPHWQRVNWDSPMIKLLITACSYVTDDAVLEGCSGGRKYLNVLKKGKWKSISKVMAERGFFVSPQQCEDKFNDLNKRYKKLNDILGKGITCQVVEKPALLDMMDHLSEQTKDEVRKLLSSKHLFYEELCSFHNNNRLHLPHEPALQQALMLALKSRDDNDSDFRSHLRDNAVEDDYGAESDDHDEFKETWRKGAFALSGGDPSKRMKRGFGLENFNFRPQSSHIFSKGFQSQLQSPSADMHLAFPEGQDAASWWKQCLKPQSLHLEEKRLQIEMETLELEKQRFKWHCFCKKKDQELEKLKGENYRMKLENERMALEMKRMEMTQMRVESKN